MNGHCPVCNGNFAVNRATNPGDAGYSEENEAVNYRLIQHTRDDVGGDCGGSELPPDSLE